MNYSSSMIAGESLRNYGLGFLARSLRVTNLTGQWYFIPQLEIYIPPYTTQWTQNYPSGTQVGDILAQTPPGQISNVPANMPQIVSYTFSDAPITPFTGSVGQAVFQSQDILIPVGFEAVFNGVNQYLMHVDDALLDIGDNDFTIVALPTPYSILNERDIISKYSSTGNQRGFSLNRNAGRYQIIASANGINVSTASPTYVATPNQRDFLAAFYDATNDILSLSINAEFTGQFFASVSHANGIFPNTAELRIGSRQAVLNFWLGAISRVAIWVGRILNTVEIAELRDYFNDGGLVLPSAYATSLRAYWMLNEFSAGTSPVFRMDSGPNALTLTDVGNVPSTPLFPSVIPLPFTARSAVINNLTGQWYRLAELNCYIQPYTNQYTVQFPAGTQTLTLIPETPLSQFSNPIPGESLTGRVTEEVLPSFSGQFTRGLYQRKAVFALSGASVTPTPLGFIARSVEIDNPTGQWYQESNTGKWIAPYTVGVCLTLPTGATLGSMDALTPVGVTSTPIQSQIVSATYTDEILPPSSGATVNAQANTGSQELPSYAASVQTALGVPIDGTSVRIITIENPAASGVLVKIRQAYLTVFWDASEESSGQEGVIFFRRFTGTPSSGLITAAKMDTTDASPVAITRENPAVGTMTLTEYITGYAFSYGKDETTDESYMAMQGGPFNTFIYSAGQQLKPLVLREGEGVCFNVANTASQGRALASLLWTEEPLTTPT